MITNSRGRNRLYLRGEAGLVVVVVDTLPSTAYHGYYPYIHLSVYRWGIGGNGTIRANNTSSIDF